MTLKELIERFRGDVDDKQQPYLWSDDAITYWLNEAQDEACRRGDLLVDSSTPEITPIPVVKDDPWVPYDRRILWFKRIMPDSDKYTQPIPVATLDDMDHYHPGWERETGKFLKGLVLDMESYRLRAYPVLTESLELNLTVRRLPLCALEKMDDEPEIRHDHHRHLLDWVKFRAYDVDDVDMNDPKKSATGLALFEREFGTASARQEQWLRQYGGRDLVSGDFA